MEFLAIRTFATNFKLEIRNVRFESWFDRLQAIIRCIIKAVASFFATNLPLILQCLPTQVAWLGLWPVYFGQARTLFQHVRVQLNFNHYLLERARIALSRSFA